MFIPYPDFIFPFQLRIPVSGVKKALDPGSGSATVKFLAGISYSTYSAADTVTGSDE
jgi:hypothetical protein